MIPAIYLRRIASTRLRSLFMRDQMEGLALAVESQIKSLVAATFAEPSRALT
jgi:hypothetical protein